MVLAADISQAFYAATTEKASAGVNDHLQVLIIDALACMLAASGTDITKLARQSVSNIDKGTAKATILPNGPEACAAEAALVNGTMVRALDFMDIYVDADVCHPSESIPAALACAEASNATGQSFLDTVLAAFILHTHLAGKLELHRNGLHHVGHAAWVVPLIASRLAGRSADHAANALNLSASGLIVPEGFSRGHVANVKGMAFPLLAKRAIELEALAASGLEAQPGACDEVARLLGLIMGQPINPAELIPPSYPSKIEAITLKAYPAQYALQPLIAACAAFHKSHPDKVGQIDRIKVRAMKQTVMRTADQAKFRPTSREAADHSLPYCIANGLLDGGLTVESLDNERWKDADVLSLTGCMDVEAMDGGEGFAVGQPEITLVFKDGTTISLDCVYPGQGRQWRDIAVDKLALSRPHTSGQIIRAVESLAHEKTVKPLVDALRSESMAQTKAS